MDHLAALFLRVFNLSAGCSAVLAPLLLLVTKLRKRIAARSFYVLFFLLALRLILPVELKLPAPAVTVTAPDYTVAVPAPAVHAPAPRPSLAPAPEASASAAQPVQTEPEEAVREIPVLYIISAVWAAGAVFCAVFFLGGYAMARRKLLRESAGPDEAQQALLERLRGELGIRRPVGLRLSARTSGPMAMGVFRPVIVLPEEDNPGLELILRHELTHIRRWDVAYKLVLSAACWVNWFNPLVWLMDRAAGRNLELCCDDEVTRGLPGVELRRYGNILLDAARAARPIPFSTCFAGGKKQMKERLVNLFSKKRNSAALVGLVLAAAVLAGGLVACETASGVTRGPAGTPAAGGAISPENAARRGVLKDFFYENYTEDGACVVLADLTGDGLDELLVLTAGTENPSSLREGMNDFAYAQLDCYTVRDGEAVNADGSAGGLSVSGSHAGWGYLYLVPLTDRWAILDFRPYTGQGMADYSFSLYAVDEAEKVLLDSGSVSFSLDPASVMGMDAGSSREEAEQFLERVRTYRDSGVPLLAYYGDASADGGAEFAYLNLAPADAFDSGTAAGVETLRQSVAGAAGQISYALPQAGPATPEEAMDALAATLMTHTEGWVFRMPDFDGTWEINIQGQTADGKTVCYLEDEEWVPGRRYDITTGEGAWFSDLTLTASVTCHDGTHAERSICLEGTSEHALVHHDEQHHDTAPASPSIPAYNQGTHHTETHHPDTHH